MTSCEVLKRPFADSTLSCRHISIENTVEELIYSYKNATFRVELKPSSEQFAPIMIENLAIKASYIASKLYLDDSKLLCTSIDFLAEIGALQRALRGGLARANIRKGKVTATNPNLVVTKAVDIAGSCYICRGLIAPLRVKAIGDAETLELQLKGMDDDQPDIREFFTENIFPRLTISKKGGIRFLTLQNQPKPPESEGPTKPGLRRKSQPENIPNSNLILKTGVKISGLFFIASMFRTPEGIRVEAYRQGSLLTKEIEIP